MKNKNWRRIAMILSLVVAGMGCYGIGYLFGSMDTAKYIIKVGAEVLNIEKIGAAELFQQYMKLKGGLM